MARIALLAPTGMLGSAVYGVLHEHHELVLVYRDVDKLKLLDETYGAVDKHTKVQFDLAEIQQDFIAGFTKTSTSPKLQKLVDAIGEVDAVVNCAGVIKPYSLKEPIMTMFVNGAFPHLLAVIYGSKLIQITTDCAFAGLEGAPYTEESPKSPNDLYGLSKSLGEPADRALVLRTSIIGPEIHGFVSLIEWVKKQSGQTAKGFTRHLWNGITTKQFGKIVHQIVSQRDQYPATGLYHIFSSDVTKYDMVTKIAKKFGVDVTVTPDDGPVLDRRMGTVKDLNAKLQTPTFDAMLAEM